MTEFGVAQERDWSALADDEFRAIVRAEFEANYPADIRYPSRRLYWREQSAWFERMSAKGWIAPNWPRRVHSASTQRCARKSSTSARPSASSRTSSSAAFSS